MYNFDKCPIYVPIFLKPRELQQNKEVQYVTTGNLTSTARLPELEATKPNEETCLNYIRWVFSDVLFFYRKLTTKKTHESEIIDAQQRAVMRAVSDSEFGSVLIKRLVTVSRVLAAAQETSQLAQKRKSIQSNNRRSLEKTKQKPNQESALVRVSVITGLQLVFNLLRNSVNNSDDLVTETLDVARDTIINLPPLSLAPSTSLRPRF